MSEKQVQTTETQPMKASTQQRRAALASFIEREVIAEPAVQGIVVIGSVAKDTARVDSDIDAVVFLEPLDLYAVPAEAKWNPESATFHSIMDHVEQPVHVDFKRVDLQQWSAPAFEWPESLCAELCEGWVAYDRFGRIQPLITQKTQYGDETRQAKLDNAINHLNWLLSEAKTGRPFETLGATEAHYRLHSAFDYVVSALFALNRRWRTLRSRELRDLKTLAWLPSKFEAQLFLAMHAPAPDINGYLLRVQTLHAFFDEIVAKCKQDGVYGDDALDEAFIRQHDEPGRGWNIDAWSVKHRERRRTV